MNGPKFESYRLKKIYIMKDLVYAPYRNLIDLMFENFEPTQKTDLGNVDYSIAENETNYSLELVTPGYKKEDFKVSIDNGYLVVSGERKEIDEDKSKKWLRRTYLATSFSKKFKLNKDVNEDAISANYEDGILKLTVPKVESKINKQISVM